MNIKTILPLTFLSLVTTQNVYAANTADANARSVNLEVSCATGQNNCFDNFIDLDNWIEATRKPNKSAPLTVRIGNGTFLSAPWGNNLSCDGQDFTGYVSFLGEGVSNTVVQMGQPGDFAGFFKVTACEGMGFSNMTFRADGDYGYIVWGEGGSSTWNDVEVQGKGGAWSDAECGDEEGEHYWYSSKITSLQAFTSSNAYRAGCDKTWIFGSEVTSVAQAGGDHIGNQAGYNIAVSAQNISPSNNKPEVHLYGSNIRAISNDVVANSPSYLRGTVYSGENGAIHIHGTGIDSISTVGEEIYVLVAEDGGFIHASESAYVVKTAGTVTRIDNVGSTIKAPYMWEQSATAPVIISETGADSFVDTSGAFPMLHIYDSSCVLAGGPWVSVTGQCRQ